MNIPEGSPSVAVLVVSCDRYSDLWEPFFKCWFKYWPDCPYPVYLGTGRFAYPDSRVKSLLVGDDISYSDNLRKLLEIIDEEWVIFWVEDRFLSAKVDTDWLIRLVVTAQKERAGCLKLIPEDPLAYRTGDAYWGVLNKRTKYRVSMTIAIWRKQTLLSILRTGESAWELETAGTKRSNDLDEKFLALTSQVRKSPPIRHVHTIIKGRIMRSAIRFLENEGVRRALSKRVLQSRCSAIYVWSYQRFVRVFFFLQHWFSGSNKNN